MNKKQKILSLTKGILNGRSSISNSNYFIESINLIQKKEYFINKKFLKYIETDMFCFEVGIPLKDDLYNLYEKSFFSEIDYNKALASRNLPSNVMYSYRIKLVELYNSSLYKGKSDDVKSVLYNKLLRDLNITKVLIREHNDLLKLKNELSRKINLFRYHNFILTFSKTFLKKNLYFVTRSDFRTRIFPIGRGLHRASGKYKYLLNDKRSTFSYGKLEILYLKEFVSLNLFFSDINVYSKSDLHKKFDSFFISYIVLKKEVLIFLNSFISEKKNLELLGFPELNKLIVNCKEPSLVLFCLIDYFSYLLDKNYVSTLSLDFDQCSSGPMIYSLLSNDSVMGNYTNVLPLDSSIRHDLYLDFLIRLEKELENIKEPNIVKAYLKENKVFTRKFSKLLLMPTFYNMGSSGIKKLLYSTVESHTFLVKQSKAFISTMIPLLEKLLLKSYSNTINYQKHLVNICKFIFSAKGAINIRTLDGCTLRYRYLENIPKYGKIYRLNKSYSYRLFLP